MYGVGEGARTLDLRSHSPSLCQLSYAHHAHREVQLDYYAKSAVGYKGDFE